MSIEVVAEIGSSHNGSLWRALTLVDIAAECGADHVKIQLFAKDMLWRRGDPRNDAIEKLSVPYWWIPELQTRCERHGIKLMATPFSIEALDMMVGFGIETVKIASGDINYTMLLRAVALADRPIILSTGYSTLVEIERAVKTILEMNDKASITLNACVGEYPASPETANVKRVLQLKEKFIGYPNIDYGLSSHLREWWCDVAVIPFGISSIEKHICLDWPLEGPEKGHSLRPKEFRQFVKAVRDVEKASVEWPDGQFSEGELKERAIARRDPSDWLRPTKERSDE